MQGCFQHLSQIVRAGAILRLGGATGLTCDRTHWRSASSFCGASGSPRKALLPRTATSSAVHQPHPAISQSGLRSQGRPSVISFIEFLQLQHKCRCL